MNENEIILKIVENRKKRVLELGLKDDFQYLLFKENIFYWVNWIETDEYWKKELPTICEIKSISSIENNLFNNSKVDSWIKIKFLNETEYEFIVEDWRSGIDSSYKQSNLHFFVNNEEVIEFYLNYEINEFSEKYISNVVSFKDTDWIEHFKNFISKVKILNEKLDYLYKQEKIKEESKELKVKYNISDEEIKKYISNSSVKSEIEISSSTYEIGKNVGKLFKKILK